MNDPNGLVYYEGEYHLFYQYNPFGNTWGHMSWGHAVSSDLVHWKHLPLALPEADGVMIFSGSAVVDWKNTSGLGKNGKPPMVAIYTCYRPSDRMQFQCIAFSNDKGRTWTKYASNPVIDIHSTSFRDPKVQWYEPGKHWIMTVSLSAEHKVRFYSSTNLKDWTLLSEFGPAGGTAGVWECPDLFQLPVEGTHEKRWVLVVNINPGSIAGGSGGQYFIGQFDGTRFVEDPGSRPAAAPSVTSCALARLRPGLLCSRFLERHSSLRWTPALARLDEQLAIRAGRAYIAVAQRNVHSAGSRIATDSRGDSFGAKAGQRESEVTREAVSIQRRGPGAGERMARPKSHSRRPA